MGDDGHERDHPRATRAALPEHTLYLAAFAQGIRYTFVYMLHATIRTRATGACSTRATYPKTSGGTYLHNLTTILDGHRALRARDAAGVFDLPGRPSHDRARPAPAEEHRHPFELVVWDEKRPMGKDRHRERSTSDTAARP